MKAAKDFSNAATWLISSQIHRFRRALGPEFFFSLASPFRPTLAEQLQLRTSFKGKALDPFAAHVVSELNALAKLVGGTIKERARSSMQACFLEISDRILAAVGAFGQIQNPNWGIFPVVVLQKPRQLLCQKAKRTPTALHLAKKKVVRYKAFLAVKKRGLELKKAKRALRVAEEEFKKRRRGKKGSAAGSSSVVSAGSVVVKKAGKADDGVQAMDDQEGGNDQSQTAAMDIERAIGHLSLGGVA